MVQVTFTAGGLEVVHSYQPWATGGARSKWDFYTLPSYNARAFSPYGLWLPLYCSSSGVWVPLWGPTLVLAIPTALLWRADLRARKRGKSCCQGCAYDRRSLSTPATPCPECGAAPSTPAPQP